MAGPAYVAAVHVPAVPWDGIAAVTSLLLSALVGTLAYLAVHVLWRSPELALLRKELGRRSGSA